MATSAELQTDGRVQRSERSREAIVQAMLDLIGEGELTPTAQQVAERADVGVRTVFRHFSDMETLFAAMTERIHAESEKILGVPDASRALGERIEALLDGRLALFERVAPYHRSGALQRAQSDFLRTQHERDVKALRRNLLRWLPELESEDPSLAHAIEMALSFEAWERLRSEQKLSARKAGDAMRRVFRALAREFA